MAAAAAHVDLATVDLTTGLARLLSDADLRRRFRARPAETLEQMRVAPAHRAALLSIRPEQLDAQARTLLDKRMHEVRKLLPRTAARMGDDFGRAFARHAERYWPEGHRRHANDAAEFARTLAARWAAHVDRGEADAAAFAASAGRLRVRLLCRQLVFGRRRTGVHLMHRHRDGRCDSYLVTLGGILG